jgi:hypothetical protein
MRRIGVNFSSIQKQRERKQVIRPYIGVTDVASREQAREFLATFKKYRSSTSTRMFHLGLMMSRKTLRGEDSPWAKIFPTKETISQIFLDDPDVLNVLHYVDYRKPGAVHLLHDLRDATRFANAEGTMNGLQLDMTWPEAAAIIAYKRLHPQVRIILQVGPRAFEEIKHDPRVLFTRLCEYQGSLEYVLLDESAGKGEPLETERLRPFMQSVKKFSEYVMREYPSPDYEYLPRIAIAGGLGPDTVGLIGPLLEEFLDLSIDAQGKLRPSGDIKEPIDTDFVNKYIEKSFELFNRYD